MLGDLKTVHSLTETQLKVQSETENILIVEVWFTTWLTITEILASTSDNWALFRTAQDREGGSILNLMV